MATRLIYDERERLLAWSAEKIGIGAFRSDAQAIGLARDDAVVAVVVFDTFSSHDCFMHVASDGGGHWLTREFLKRAFVYPFVQCGLPRVSSPIAESNTKALAFNLHLGFAREGYHPDACSTGAVITTGLLRKNCIYIPKEYRK
jgi:RimJ/RimL family protein N-acetyltransferase